MSAERYLYLDDDSQVQGPFAGDELLGWLADGYFQPETPLWPAPVASDDDACRAAAEKSRDAFKPFHTFFPHTKKKEETPAAVVVAAPAVIPTVVETPVPVPAAAAAAPPPPPRPVAAVPAVVAAPVAPPVAIPSLWFYLDDVGGERGPYPASDMASWFQAGFFNAQTKVRTENEKECRPFGERGVKEETFVVSAAATPAATTTAANTAALDVEDVFETDMDLMMDADEQEEEEEEDQEDAEQEGEAKEADNEEKSKDDSDMKEQGTKAKPATSDTAVKSLAPSSLRWFYTDPAGVEQGPFTAVSMLRWHRAGFFAFNDSPLRRADEDKAVPLSARTAAPSFYSAVIPSAAVSVQKENRWYYLDTADVEQGPFTEVQMRGWWDGNFLKPTLRVRQVGEPESAFSPISTRDCGFTRPAPAPLLVPAPMPPVAYIAPGYAPPHPAAHSAYPYAAAASSPHPYAYQGHNPYGAAPAAPLGGYASAPYGAPYGNYPPPPPRGNPSGDYSQAAGFSGHRGRGRHVVGSAYQEQRQPHDPLSNYIHPAALDQWQQQDRSKRQRY